MIDLVKSQTWVCTDGSIGNGTAAQMIEKINVC